MRVSSSGSNIHEEPPAASSSSLSSIRPLLHSSSVSFLSLFFFHFLIFPLTKSFFVFCFISLFCPTPLLCLHLFMFFSSPLYLFLFSVLPQWKWYFAVDLEAALDLFASVPVAGRDQCGKCLHLQQQRPVFLQHRQLDVAVQDPEPESSDPQQPRPKRMQ